jgi:hypothetical protein
MKKFLTVFLLIYSSLFFIYFLGVELLNFPSNQIVNVVATYIEIILIFIVVIPSEKEEMKGGK